MALQFSTALRTARVSQVETLATTVTNGAWAVSTAYTSGQTVTNGGNTYRCTTSGTSASSGGPSGTGATITDGTAVWTYAPPALKLFTGAEPANCAASDPSGGMLTGNLPMSFLSSSGGAASLAGSWSWATSAGGVPTAFRIYDPSGSTCVLQGSVGTSQQWAVSTAYGLGAIVYNGSNLYQVTAAGTSASSGGPTGTGSSITDNTVTWQYLMAQGDLLLNNQNLSNGQTVTVSSFTVTDANS